MGTRTVRRSATGVDPLTARFTQFLTLKANAEAMGTRADILKKALSEHAVTHGQKDEEKGHLVVTLSTPVEVAGKQYTGFMRQKRPATPTFNEERAQELCEAKGIAREDFISTQEYVDQDKVYRLYADDLLTDEEMKSLLDQGNPTWAFVPVKGS